MAQVFRCVVEESQHPKLLGEMESVMLGRVIGAIQAGEARIRKYTETKGRCIPEKTVMTGGTPGS